MRGDLSETTAADACRRLAEQGATGALVVDGPDGVGTVTFVDGHIVAATSPAPRSRLGDRLVGSGYLTDDALDEALALQREAPEGTRLGALLVDRELVSQDAVRLFVQEQVLDALFDVFRWRFGAYDFAEDEAADVQEVPLRVAVDEALVEVSRRQQEWDELSQVIPSLDAIPSFRPGAGSAAAPLEPDEFAVLASVDGERSVRTLADDLGYGEFEAARILYGLCLLGIVEVRAPEDEIGAALDNALAFADDAHAEPDLAPPDRVEPASGQEWGAAAQPPDRDQPAVTEQPADTDEPRGDDEPRGADDTTFGRDTHPEPEIDLKELDELFAHVQLGDIPDEAPSVPDEGQADEERSAPEPDGFFANLDAGDGGPARTRDTSTPPPDDPRTPDDLPPVPEDPALGTAGAPHPTGGKDTDVSEFLRELSRLALSHDDTPAQPPHRPPEGGGQAGAKKPPEPPARRPDPDDRGRRKRGLFGRGG